MKNVAVIPIALGSKRIPDKDVEELRKIYFN